MKKQLIFMLVIFLPCYASAQLAKQMSKYHEKKGVTVTQLDKNLYALYQKENLPTEMIEMLQRLDEVNILNLDINACEPDITNKIISQFRGILDNSEKYKLVKSRNNGSEKQLIYTQSKNNKITNLVVWNQSPTQIDLIDLQGDIQLDRIALLSKALNLQGLNSLAMLSPNSVTDEFSNSREALRQAAEAMQNLGGGFMDGFDSLFSDFFGNTADSLSRKDHSFDPFNHMGSMMDIFEDMDINPERMQELMKDLGHSHKVEKFFQSFGDGDNTSSSSVQITEENGKTKLKIDSKNSDMTYIIDGKQAPKDNIQMPESILNVNIIPSREDIKKSYLFITSKNKLGEFTGFKEGLLTFKYDNQEYKYNLDKAQGPLLVIDGRLSSTFGIEPSEILQIRPISQIEKEVGYYPQAEVIINTK